MTPIEITFLIHCHVFCEPYPNPSPVVNRTIERFSQQGLIVPTAGENNMFETTDRGKALVKMICTTPFPELQWIDPRTKEAIDNG
jgi:hypothetical protein